MLLIALMKQVQGPPQLWMTGDVRHPQSCSMLKKQEKKPILSRSTKRMGERRATDNQTRDAQCERYLTYHALQDWVQFPLVTRQQPPYYIYLT